MVIQVKAIKNNEIIFITNVTTISQPYTLAKSIMCEILFYEIISQPHTLAKSVMCEILFYEGII